MQELHLVVNIPMPAANSGSFFPLHNDKACSMCSFVPSVAACSCRMHITVRCELLQLQLLTDAGQTLVDMICS